MKKKKKSKKSNLKWKKRESYTHISGTHIRESCERNEEGWPLFVIEKNRRKYRLYCATDCMISRHVAWFKTQTKAKQVAELIYSDSRYARKKKK